jgi:hypothetical protein
MPIALAFVHAQHATTAAAELLDDASQGISRNAGSIRECGRQ